MEYSISVYSKFLWTTTFLDKSTQVVLFKETLLSVQREVLMHDFGRQIDRVETNGTVIRDGIGHEGPPFPAALYRIVKLDCIRSKSIFIHPTDGEQATVYDS